MQASVLALKATRLEEVLQPSLQGTKHLPRFSIQETNLHFCLFLLFFFLIC